MGYLDETEFYNIEDRQHYCCGESQFVHYCKNCGENMGCYYCEFSYTEPHDCDRIKA